MNRGGWGLWVAVSGLMGSVDAVWPYVCVMDFLNSLARDRYAHVYFTVTDEC